MEAMRTELCPKCGSAKVEQQTPGLVLASEAKATCHNCGWEGTLSELMAAAIPETAGLAGDPALTIAQDISTAYLKMLSKHAAQPIGLAMIESGVIGVKDKTNLAKLIRAACHGAHTATLKEVERIQKELSGERPRSGN